MKEKLRKALLLGVLLAYAIALFLLIFTICYCLSDQLKKAAYYRPWGDGQLDYGRINVDGSKVVCVWRAFNEDSSVDPESLLDLSPNCQGSVSDAGN